MTAVKKRQETFGLYLWLAGVNLFISAFTFGGGYVVVPMVRKYFVQRKRAFTEEELMEMAAVAQSAPGAIAVNLASLAGYRVAGRAGLILSCVCALLPSLLILSLVSVCYAAFVSNTAVAAALKGMQAGAAALIVDFIVDMTRMIGREHSRTLNLLVAASFAVSFFTDLNVIWVLLGSCLICVLQACRKRNEVILRQ